MLRARAQENKNTYQQEVYTMLDRLFGNDGFFGAGAWWIIVLFFLFLAFQECFSEICITDWIPFLILLLIVCSCGNSEDDDDCNYMENNMNYSCNC